MAKCAYCNTNVLFGGVKHGELKFCNSTCYQDGYLINASKQVDPEIVQEHVTSVYQGDCPKCKKKSGPVDFHTSYRCISMIALTQWSSKPQISCKSCASKSQWSNLAISGLLGWWGVPWGFIMTPIQVTRNIAGIVKKQDLTKPSPQLEKMIRLNIAAHLLSQQQAIAKAEAAQAAAQGGLQ